VVEQIKELVAPLSLEERLRVIQAISGMPESSSSLDLSTEEMLADQEWWYTLPRAMMRIGKRCRFTPSLAFGWSGSRDIRV
jgi:hypothetical protein